MVAVRRFPGDELGLDHPRNCNVFQFSPDSPDSPRRFARRLAVLGWRTSRTIRNCGRPFCPRLQLAALAVEAVAVGLELGDPGAQPRVLGQCVGQGVDGHAELVARSGQVGRLARLGQHRQVAAYVVARRGEGRLPALDQRDPARSCGPPASRRARGRGRSAGGASPPPSGPSSWRFTLRSTATPAGSAYGGTTGGSSALDPGDGQELGPVRSGVGLRDHVQPVGVEGPAPAGQDRGELVAGPELLGLTVLAAGSASTRPTYFSQPVVRPARSSASQAPYSCWENESSVTTRCTSRPISGSRASRIWSLSAAQRSGVDSRETPLCAQTRSQIRAH